MISEPRFGGFFIATVNPSEETSQNISHVDSMVLLLELHRQNKYPLRVSRSFITAGFAGGLRGTSPRALHEDSGHA